MRKLVLILIILLSVSCSKKNGVRIIAVSQCSEDIWRNKLNRELLVASYAHEDIELRFASANDNNIVQRDQIRNFIQEKVDLLIIAPNQLGPVDEAIEEAYEKGIPVILFDRKAMTDKYTAFVGADNYEIGRQMGEYLASSLSYKGDILEITGLSGSSPAVDRHEGFIDAIGKYKQLNLRTVLKADWTKEKARIVTDSLLNIQSDFSAVFAQNDRMAQGAMESFEAHSFDGVKFFGIDALPGSGNGIDDVIKGRMEATFLYPTRGDIVMEVAMSILEGREYSRETRLQTTLVDEHIARTIMMQTSEIESQMKDIAGLHQKVNFYLGRVATQRIFLAIGAISIVLLIIICILGINYIRIRSRLHKQERTADEAKLEFFTNVSHEIRTPLTLISGNIDVVLEDKNLSAVSKESLLMAQRNNATLLRLASQILDFRKIESGNMRLELSEFDLLDAVKEWMKGFNDVATASRKRLSVLCTEEKIMVVADMRKIERILFNLVSNALKYTLEEGNIIVSLVRKDDDILLQVSDNGVGIPEQEVNDIFDKFYKGNNANVGGTGIGLALVKSYIQLHSGKVSVKSEVGKGTTFSISLPAKQPEYESSLQNAIAPSGLTEYVPVEFSYGANDASEYLLQNQNLEQRTMVLVVDDNQDVRAFIKSILPSTYTYVSAFNGKQGLQKALELVPDIIISDVMMPEMDGIQLCKMIKTNLRTSHIPVVLLSAKAQEEHITQGLDNGADAYIPKPFSPKILISTLRTLLENRSKLKEFFSGTAILPETTSTTEREFLERLTSIINERIADSALTVDDLSDAVAMSRVQLYRKVKALTGESPVELLRHLRLQAAEKLLKCTSKTISEIAYATGFASVSYFSKCYKEYYGHSPSKN